MSKENETQLTFMALKYYPPSIRNDLMKSQLLGIDKSKLIANWVSFGSEELSFLRKNIFDAIRGLFQSQVDAHIEDKSGRDWKLAIVDAPTRTSIKFQHENISFVVSDCFALHPDPDVRKKIFEEAALKVGMTKSKRDEWLNLIFIRPLHDDELSHLLEELSGSPKNIEQVIRERVKEGEVDYPTLIPDVESYYEDQVGVVGPHQDIFSFAKVVSKRKFNEILEFERTEGLKRILRQSAHFALVDEIELAAFSNVELEATFGWISESADVLSKVGAVELAIGLSHCSSKIAASAIQMINSIRGDDLSTSGALAQFCDLVFLVGGELMRNGLFSSYPPYWRRLAIFSHAAVIQWAVLANNTNVSHLAETQCYSRGPLFLIQSAVDLRLEPRWQAGYLGPTHLKAEFLGRILVAAQRCSGTLHEDLKAYILDDPEFKKEVHFPLAYLPGPLEGGVESAMVLPQDLNEAIESALSASPLELASFIPLVNSALVFKLDEGQADLASKALRAANYQLRSANNELDLQPILNGLATVAAVTRSPSLADEVIILMRVVRNRSGKALSVDHTLTIGLIAAAARSNERDWLEFVGALLTEISFQKLSAIEAQAVRYVLLQLCRLKPELWRHCGGAHAALESLLPYEN